MKVMSGVLIALTDGAAPDTTRIAKMISVFFMQTIYI